MRPDAWGALRGLPVTLAADGGLINETWIAGDPPRFVAQRVSPIFTPRVHEDIEAVTAWIAQKGLVTPRLVRTDAGALCALAGDEVWRVLTFVPGRTHHRVTSPALAASAATLIARFHAAVADLSWSYQNVRPEAHDTPLHLARLARVRDEGGPGDPALQPEARRVADEILAAWGAWAGRLDLPPRHSHGDLKISNLRFDDTGTAICLLDLDTLALLPLDVELGDALRSWCNPVGEDAVETRFDLDVFSAAIQAYLAAGSVTADERACLVSGVERIALELASRFCRDVFEDRYFGYNAQRFPSRAAHNLFRAQGQLNLARDIARQRAEAERAVAG